MKRYGSSLECIQPMVRVAKKVQAKALEKIAA